jgi:hypothetical protein
MNTAKTTSINLYTNENKVRLTAFFVLVLAILYLVFNKIIFPLFLVVDFALRAFSLQQCSPLALLSGWLVKTFKQPVKPVFFPPKRFAARIGFLFSIAILFLHLLYTDVSFIVAAVLGLFAALESFFGFCAGCYVYNFFQRFKKADNKN